MARASDEPEVSVSEDSGKYVSATVGPATDTIVHTRNTPGIAPNLDPAVYERANRASPDPNLPDIRKSMRKPEEVERHRPRRARRVSVTWLGILAFFVVLVVGGTVLVLGLRHREPAPAAPPAAPTEIGGVPVRPGMKGTVDQGSSR